MPDADLGGDPPCWAHLLDAEGDDAMDDAPSPADERAANDNALDPTAEVQR